MLLKRIKKGKRDAKTPHGSPTTREPLKKADEKQHARKHYTRKAKVFVSTTRERNVFTNKRLTNKERIAVSLFALLYFKFAYVSIFFLINFYFYQFFF